MNATEVATTAEIIPLPQQRKRSLPTKQRFKIIPFTNRNGSQSWRVSGIKRDGERVRENFADLAEAEARQTNLQLEYLSGHTEAAIQKTTLTEKQIRLAEACFRRLESDDDLERALNYWFQHGRKQSVKTSKRLDEAFTEFKQWLDGLKPGDEEYVRDLSKRNLKTRVNIFVNNTSNIDVANITPETIATCLQGRNVSAKTRDNDRRAISRFFNWCIEKRWAAVNPAAATKRRKKQGGAKPSILTVEQCKALLRASMDHKEGALAPYVALSLFAGLRPWESRRLEWAQINLTDLEIGLRPDQTKTKTSRTVKIHKTLAAWLNKYKDKPIFTKNWRRDFDAIKAAAGFGGRSDEDEELVPWTPDIMRHTAISHHFRDCGLYGLTAEQFGNSESIIKAHYQTQDHASTKHTAAFYKLTPAAVGKGAK